MFSLNIVTASTLISTFILPVSAFWRLPCNAPIVSERADPIISPGVPASHLHTIMGGNGFGFDMDFADTQESTCSSCIVTKDFSNYWVPSLYYQAENGSFMDVQQFGGATIYYLQRSDPQDPEYSSGLLAFPEDFRMLAGNTLLRNYTDTVEQQAISYACLGADDAYMPGLPPHNCPDGVRAQVFFPSCWDGVNLDSPDHKSHMAYPSIYNAGVCPPSHPKRFISLFYEVVWNTNAFKDMWYGSKQPFVFANGDDTGYGYHGDFVNGWDVPTLQRAVTECTNDSGVVQDCHVFDFFTDDFTRACKIPPSVDEQTTGILAALPGCNPVQSGPEEATMTTGCGAPTTIGLPENNFVDLTVSKGYQYIGCGYDIAGAQSSLKGAFFIAANMTNEYCVGLCKDRGFSIAATEYSDQCYCGNSIPSDRLPTPGLYGNCDMPCPGDANESCGGQLRMSLYQKCESTCQNINYIINNGTSGGKPAVSTSATSPLQTTTTLAPINLPTPQAPSPPPPPPTTTLLTLTSTTITSTTLVTLPSTTSTTSYQSYETKIVTVTVTGTICPTA